MTMIALYNRPFAHSRFTGHSTHFQVGGENQEVERGVKGGLSPPVGVQGEKRPLGGPGGKAPGRKRI